MVDTVESKRRWYRLTPDRLILGLLAVEGLLLLSERFRWFAFNQHKGWTVLIAVAAVGAAFLVMLLWLAIALLVRRRFQFSLRALFVLTVAVAVPFSWLGAEMRAAKRQKEAVAAIVELQGYVAFDCQLDPSTYTAPGAKVGLSVTPGGKTPWVAWLWRALGQDFFAEAVFADCSFPQVTDAAATVEHLKGLTKLRFLYLSGTQLTDAGLERLKGLTKLQFLVIGGTQVTDAGLEHLKGLSQLRDLDLSGTRITGSGLKHLKGLSHLESLDLKGTQVTDADLEHLNGLAHLQWLYLDRKTVTDEGVKDLKRELPNCHIDNCFSFRDGSTH
jgi:hypothetical protein